FIYGGSIYIAMSAKGSSDRRMRTSRVIRMARDLVRTLEERARELKLMTRKAEDANRAKSSFLANVSHEIRTPLNSILGMSQLALTSEVPPEQREQLETIRGSAKTLLAVIEDILDLSKIEALKMELEEVPFSIRETLFDGLKALGYEAYSKGLELAGYVDPAVPDRLSGDPVRIRQIVLNLVGNAIKFTDEGSVIVGLTLEEHRDREALLHLRVNDTGPGIPEGQLDAIFVPFSHTQPGTVRRRGGTGLGLSICAKLAELMRGRIWVESEPGEGSSFHCTFALRLKAQTTPLPRLLSHRTLVGDANDCSREFIAATLETWGATVHTSNHPEEMLAELAMDSSRFDSVIIDSDWFSSDPTTIHAALALTTASTRVSAILPHPGDFRTANHCRGIGCNHFISRPVSEEEILEASKPEEAEMNFTSPAIVRAGEPLEILVVDDDRINQEVTGGLLRRLGHQVTVLGSGNAALDLLSRRKFDLLLFDVEMPGMDGFELTRIVRALDSEKRTPIAALTAHAMKGDRERCLAAGMDDYLTKPIDLEALAALVRRLGGSAAGPETFAERGGSRLQKRLARLFLDNSPEMLERISRAMEGSDAAEVAAAAHTIKGSAMNFDAPDVVEAAAKIENLAREGSVNDARDALPNLAAALDRLRAVLLRSVGEEVSST
ncbi:MAG TPA: response regulator, partial [Thermoanaerobaculia bacterium]|nr:response regulator [Thermoanaerobaculia bacterium]